MRWHDIISKAVVFLIFIIVWRLSLRLLSQCIPTFSGRHKYFPKHLINDDDALNRHRLNISRNIYPQLRKQADHEKFKKTLNVRAIGFRISCKRKNVKKSLSSKEILYLPGSYKNFFFSLAHWKFESLPPTEDNSISLSYMYQLGRSEVSCAAKITFSEHLLAYYKYPGKSSRSSTLDEIIIKEALDYWKCLNRTTTNRYVLLLEDDALVIPDFARMLSSLVEQLDVHDSIDYVKMYHPNHLRRIPSIPMGITLCFVLSCTYCFAIYRRVLLCWILVTSTILFLELRSYSSQFIADSRYHLTKSIYMSSTESCCTPAVLFRTSKIEEIVFELDAETRKNARNGHAKDHILDESRFVGRQTDMNLVVHIGAYSSVRKRRVKLK